MAAPTSPNDTYAAVSFVSKLKVNAKAARAAANAFKQAVKDPEATQRTPTLQDDDRAPVQEDLEAQDKSTELAVINRSPSSSVSGQTKRVRMGSVATVAQASTAIVTVAQDGFAIMPHRRGRRVSSLASRRSEAATDGISLLKKGCPAVKVSQRGRQRPTTFTLSDDESTLYWEGVGLSARLKGARSVPLSEVLQVMVGAQSEAFRRAQSQSQRTPLNESTCLTLVLSTTVMDDDGGLSQKNIRVSGVGGGKHSSQPSSPDQRSTLDIYLHDETTFGLWLAALRALTNEVRAKPAPYANPMNPLHASAAASLQREAPEDASCYEKLRDASLRGLAYYTQTRLFLITTILWVLAVSVFGVLYFFLLIGWHGFTPLLIVDDLTGQNITMSGQDRANELANVSVHALTGLFSYILGLTLPWRLANTIHLMNGCGGCLTPYRSCAPGHDLYGRPTNGIWFHIPTHKRRRIVFLLMANVIFQYATQAARIIWPSYNDSQAMPGILWINLTFLLSLVPGITSGMAQGCAEGAVRKANPNRFPPTPFESAMAAWREAKEALAQEEQKNANLAMAQAATMAAQERKARVHNAHAEASGKASLIQGQGMRAVETQAL